MSKVKLQPPSHENDDSFTRIVKSIINERSGIVKSDVVDIVKQDPTFFRPDTVANNMISELFQAGTSMSLGRFLLWCRVLEYDPVIRLKSTNKKYIDTERSLN